MPLCPKRGDFWLARLARPMQKAKRTNMNARGPLLFAWGPRAVLLGRARGGVAARRQRLRRGGVRRDEGIPPYGRPFGHGHPVWPGAGNLFVGAGFTAPAGAFRRPTAAQRRLLENLFVGAGFTAPAGAFRRPTAAQRRLLGRRSRPWDLAPPSGPRADMESAPTGGKAISRPRAFAAPQACGTMRASSPTVSMAITFAARRQRLRRGKAGRYGIGPYGLNGFLGPGFASAGGPYTPAGRVVSSRGAPPARSSAVRGWGAAGAAPRFSRATASISLMRFSWLTRVALGS